MNLTHIGQVAEDASVALHITELITIPSSKNRADLFGFPGTISLGIKDAPDDVGGAKTRHYGGVPEPREQNTEEGLWKRLQRVLVGTCRAIDKRTKEA